MKDIIRQWGVVVAAAATIAANALANALPLNGQTTGAISDRFPVYFMVVGGALAGMISIPRRDVAYLLVILWAFAGIAVKQAGAPVVANTAWVVAGLLALAMGSGFLLFRKDHPKPVPIPVEIEERAGSRR